MREPMTGTNSTPKCFLCPLRGCLMEDPVLILSSGQSVDRQSFVRWIADGKLTCPVSGVHLNSYDYKPNYALKSCVEWWKNKSEAATKGQDLLSAAMLGDLRHVKNLVKFIDSDPRGPIGESPLHNAALWGHLDIVRELVHVVSMGSSIDVQDYEGRTPLWCAAFMGRAEICQELLHSGADAKLPSYFGNTPLKCAISRGHAEVVKVLHASGELKLGNISLQLAELFLRIITRLDRFANMIASRLGTSSQ